MATYHFITFKGKCQLLWKSGKMAKVDVKSYPMYRCIPSTSLLASDLALDSSNKASMQPEKKVLPKQSDLQKQKMVNLLRCFIQTFCWKPQGTTF